LIEIHPTIFRAYDIRGRYQKDIDQIIFYQIGLATGTHLKKNLNASSLAVGNDVRKTSESLSYAFISGLSAVGADVVNTGTCSFGQTLFYGWKHKHDLISFITASHLPAEWNGVKFYHGDGVGLPEEELITIRDITLGEKWQLPPWNQTGNVQIADPKLEYQEFFRSRFHFKKNIRIAVDCGGGSMALSAPYLFEKLGLSVVPVYCNPDPLFSVRPSDPKSENLSTLVETVKKEHCDFGVAFDGDGDRSVIVDEMGQILSADQTGILLGKYGLNQSKGTVIVNVECSMSIEEQLQPLGFSIKYIPVGHTFLTLHAKNENALLGIESSGHFIMPQYFLFDDAIIVPLKIAEIIESHSSSLSSLLSEIPIYPRRKVQIDCEDTIKFDVVYELKKKLLNDYDEVTTLDGIRVDLGYGWVLIRASNTSPLIRLTVEAGKIEKIDEISLKFQKEIETCINKIIP